MHLPAEEKQVQDTESALKIKFPLAYREKMLKENGGDVEINKEVYHLIPVGNGGGDGSTEDVVSGTRERKKTFTYPNDGIAIAANEAGDTLVFVKEYYHSDKLKNGVFLWNKKIGYIKRVAEDFSKLL